MASWGKLTFAQKQCVSATGKLMQQTGMVSHGSRIGLAVSGGVDSFLMLRVMLIRQAIMPFPVELMVLHVNPGFAPESQPRPDRLVRAKRRQRPPGTDRLRPQGAH